MSTSKSQKLREKPDTSLLPTTFGKSRTSALDQGPGLMERIS